MSVDCVLLLALVLGGALWVVLKTGGNQNPNSSARPGEPGCAPFQPLEAQRSNAEPSNSGLFSASASYRVKDGSDDYQFRFVQIADRSFQVYVLQTPNSRGGLEPAGPHLLRDHVGPYVCWSVPIVSYQEAKMIAARWAEATEEWRKTGKGF